MKKVMFRGQASTSLLWQVLLIATFVWWWSESLWLARSAPYSPVNHFKVLLNLRNSELLRNDIANPIDPRIIFHLILNVLYIKMLMWAWASTFPTAMKPFWLRDKLWKLLFLSSGTASAAEQKWKTNSFFQFSKSIKQFLQWLSNNLQSPIVCVCLLVGLKMTETERLSGSTRSRKPSTQPT